MTNVKRSRLPGTPEPGYAFTGAGNNRLAADAWGDVNHQSVILMHGGGQTRHAWKGTGQKLAAAGYYALSLDLRGHGDSDWVGTDAGYTEEEMAADLACVIDEAGLQNPVLVGASLGGMTALSAIGLDVVDARALVLVDIVPGYEQAGAERVLEFMAQGAQGFNSIDDIAAAIAAYQPHRERQSARKLDGLSKNVRLGDDGRYYWHWDPAFLKRAARDYAIVQRRLHDYAAGLTLPTLLVRGGLSDLLTDEGTDEFLRTCPHAEYTSVTDAAHMVAGDRNDIFTDAVVGFLNRLSGFSA